MRLAVSKKVAVPRYSRHVSVEGAVTFAELMAPGNNAGRNRWETLVEFSFLLSGGQRVTVAVAVAVPNGLTGQVRRQQKFDPL